MAVVNFCRNRCPYFPFRYKKIDLLRVVGEVGKSVICFPYERFLSECSDIIVPESTVLKEKDLSNPSTIR
jgi:hypothetical protein